jgi:NADH dehydrogenase
MQPGSYAHALKEAGAIFHLAALTHSCDSKAYFRVNVQGTRCLLNAARDAGFSGRFIYMGTRSLGVACGAYGESKAQAEKLVCGSGLPWTILRPGEVYGAGQGEALDTVARMVRLYPVVLIPGDGGHLLAPVHVDDIIAGALAALQSTQTVHRIYTLAGPQEFSFISMVNEIERIFKVRRFKMHIPLMAFTALGWMARTLGLASAPVVSDQIPRLLCHKSSDIQPARTDFGFSPRTIEEGLLSLLNPNTC